MTCYQAKQHNIEPRVLVVPHTHTNACAQEEAGSKGQQANQHLPAQHSHHALAPNVHAISRVASRAPAQHVPWAHQHCKWHGVSKVSSGVSQKAATQWGVKKSCNPEELLCTAPSVTYTMENMQNQHVSCVMHTTLLHGCSSRNSLKALLQCALHT